MYTVVVLHLSSLTCYTSTMYLHYMQQTNKKIWQRLNNIPVYPRIYQRVRSFGVKYELKKAP